MNNFKIFFIYLLLNTLEKSNDNNTTKNHCLNFSSKVLAKFL